LRRRFDIMRLKKRKNSEFAWKENSRQGTRESLNGDEQFVPGLGMKTVLTKEEAGGRSPTGNVGRKGAIESEISGEIPSEKRKNNWSARSLHFKREARSKGTIIRMR